MSASTRKLGYFKHLNKIEIDLGYQGNLETKISMDISFINYKLGSRCAVFLFSWILEMDNYLIILFNH